MFVTLTRSGRLPFSLFSCPAGNVEDMDTTPTVTAADETSTPHHRVSADVVLGLSLLGVAILGKMLWTLSDGGLLAALGAR
jgi:hypothetical protein